MSGKVKFKVEGTKTLFQQDKRSIMRFVPKLRKVKKKKP
jgi:hypothetical protein